MSTIAAKFVTVTPETAQRWLGRNQQNRNVRALVVTRYARDMAAGRWEATGEAVKFDTTGALIDGQHRLLACIQAGTPFTTLVATGLATSAQRLLDTGASRTAGDMLTLGGYSHATMLASAARIACAREAGMFTAGRFRGYRATHAEIQARVELNPAIHPAAESARYYYRQGVAATPGALAYVVLLLNKVDPVACSDFFTAMATNSTSGEGDPRHVLLRRLSNAQQRRQVISAPAQVSLIIRAWNAHRTGRTVRVLPVIENHSDEYPLPQPL